MVSVTEQWAQYSVAGPHSRDAAAQRWSIPTLDLSERRLSLISRCGEFTSRRHSGAAVPDLVFRRTRLRDRGARRLWRRAGSRADGGGRASSAHAVRHRSAGGDADRERPCRRQRAERADHRARSRARPHDVEARRTYIGRVMAERPALVDPARPTLVGLRPVDPCASPARRRASPADRRYATSGERPGLHDLDGFQSVAADTGSGSVCWRAGPSGSASRSGSTIRFARRFPGRDRLTGVCRSGRRAGAWLS